MVHRQVHDGGPVLDPEQPEGHGPAQDHAAPAEECRGAEAARADDQKNEVGS